MRFDLNKFLTAAKQPHVVSFCFDLSGRDWPGYQLPAPVKGTFRVDRTPEGARITLDARPRWKRNVPAALRRCTKIIPSHSSTPFARLIWKTWISSFPWTKKDCWT